MPMIKVTDLPTPVKVGDEVSFTVKAIKGEDIELDYTNPVVEKSMEEMSEGEMQEMPLDKLESKLPKAER